MRSNWSSIRAALCVSTALLLAPVAATAAELSYIETASLQVGDKVFLPDAVAFETDGQSVTCAEIAFHVAQEQAACFHLLTMMEIEEIARLAKQGRNFTTTSGLSFAAGPQGIVGLNEAGQSFAVAGASPAPGDAASDMTEGELAAFLGLDNAAQLGGAQAGIGVGATAGTGTGVSVDADADVSIGTTDVSADVDADADTSGVSASVDADADADAGTGGVSASVSGDADAGSGGVSADADASAGTGGVSAGVSGGADAGSDGVSGGVSGGADSGGAGAEGGVSAGIE